MFDIFSHFLFAFMYPIYGELYPFFRGYTVPGMLCRGQEGNRLVRESSTTPLCMKVWVMRFFRNALTTNSIKIATIIVPMKMCLGRNNKNWIKIRTSHFAISVWADDGHAADAIYDHHCVWKNWKKIHLKKTIETLPFNHWFCSEPPACFFLFFLTIFAPRYHPPTTRSSFDAAIP